MRHENFKLHLAGSIKETSQLLQRTEAELSDSKRKDPRLLLASTRNRLSNNRAFVGQQCIRPEQRPLPIRPKTRCTSRQECLQDGASICFTRYLGESGCGVASSELGGPGILSRSDCAAAAARLAGEKYELGDAVVDAIMGIVDDEAADLQSNDSLSDNFLGFAIETLSEVRKLEQAKLCTNSFVQKHYGPMEAWQSNARSITTEPYRLVGSCQRDLDSLHSLESALIHSPNQANTDRLEAKVAELKGRQRTLETEKRPLEFCKAG